MAIEKSDTFPLWSFGYMHPPVYDKNKVMTSRERTWEEAWICIQLIGRSFMESEKVGVIASVRLKDKENYCKTHPYDWLHDAPLWLKQQEGEHASIW